MLTAFKTHLKRYMDEQEIEWLLDTFSGPRKQGLLLNTNKLNQADLLAVFPTLTPHPIIPNAFIYDPEALSPGKHYLFASGCYYLQDLSAMLVGHLLNVEANEMVADLCAAPGGKTTQVALKSPDALIIANDLSGLRAKAMATNIERFGLNHVVVTNHDASDLLGRSPFSFHKIILDAPCSGSGMFRKREDMMADWSLNKVLKFQEIQKELIIKAYDALCEGGELIYSTCSFSYEEDEEVILHLLSQRNAEIVPISLHSSFDESKTVPGAIHLFPYHYEGDGHFICKIKKPGQLNIIPLRQAELTKFGVFSLKLNIIQQKPYFFGFKYQIKLPFNIIRPGIFLGTIEKGIVDYNHHLALSLDPSLSYSINQKERDLYLAGETFENKQIPDGFQVVNYAGVNLGFVKAKNGIIKNHYPKGLRVR